MNSKDGPVDVQLMDRNSALAPLLFALEPYLRGKGQPHTQETKEW